MAPAAVAVLASYNAAILSLNRSRLSNRLPLYPSSFDRPSQPKIHADNLFQAQPLPFSAFDHFYKLRHSSRVPEGHEHSLSLYPILRPQPEQSFSSALSFSAAPSLAFSSAPAPSLPVPTVPPHRYRLTLSPPVSFLPTLPPLPWPVS